MDQRIKELAEQAGFSVYEDGWIEGCVKAVEHLEKLIRADEREACAKLCKNVVSNEGYVQAKYCAAAIRARGDKHD